MCEQPQSVFNAAGLNSKKSKNISIDKYVDNFSDILEKYQNKEYSKIFLSNVKKVIEKENQIDNSEKNCLYLERFLTLFRAMRYKDEYEVARLHTSGDFAQTFLNENKNAKLEYYLAPPLFSKKDPDTGHLLKRRFGSSVFKIFKVLSYFKFLRGTKLDIFGYTLERKKNVL